MEWVAAVVYKSEPAALDAERAKAQTHAKARTDRECRTGIRRIIRIGEATDGCSSAGRSRVQDRSVSVLAERERGC